MINQNSTAFRLLVLILLAAFCFAAAVSAQDKKTPETTSDGDGVGETVFMPMGITSSTTDDDDSKVTGATVRGRLVYEDTNRPMRYVMITLISGKEGSNIYGSKFVKTDENGNFVIRNVAAGTYIPYVRSEGILNRNSYRFSFRRANPDDKSEQLFEKIEIGGLGDFQIVVAARRGGAISGKILYSDGEVAVGVKVEALRKDGGRFSNISSSYESSDTRVGVAETDDRGVYRISGLPEGQYIVRVIEPFSHGQNSPQMLYNMRENQTSILRTYYPEGENSKDAREMEILPGQEQTGIDIVMPERRLFTLSGKIVKKSDGKPIENFMVSFYRLGERDELVLESRTSTSTFVNKIGEWTLKGLPKGKYRISITQGYVYRDGDQKQKVETFTNMSREIEITDENLTNINFEVPFEATISGTIIVEGGKPLPENARIFASNDATKVTNFSDYDYFGDKKTTDKKETPFRIGKLSEGKYRLGSMAFTIKSATLGGRDVLTSLLDVKEGEDIKGVVIVISVSMGTIKGKVEGFDGKEEALAIAIEAGATFTDQQPRNFNAMVTPTGDFEIKAAPGEYTLVILTRKNQPPPGGDFKTWFENLVKSGQKITVKENETTSVTASLPN